MEFYHWFGAISAFHSHFFGSAILLNLLLECAEDILKLQISVKRSDINSNERCAGRTVLQRVCGSRLGAPGRSSFETLGARLGSIVSFAACHQDCQIFQGEVHPYCLLHLLQIAVVLHRTLSRQQDNTFHEGHLHFALQI